MLTHHLSLHLLLAPQKKNGETFVSETDTETIPKLLKFAYDSMTAEAGSGEAQVPFPKVSPELGLQRDGMYVMDHT